MQLKNFGPQRVNDLKVKNERLLIDNCSCMSMMHYLQTVSIYAGIDFVMTIYFEGRTHL